MPPTDFQLLQSQIMRRVYLIYWWRRCYHSWWVKLSSLALLLTLDLRLVSAHDVWDNLNDLEGFWPTCRFISASFLGTDVATKSALLASVIFSSLVFGRALWRQRPSFLLPA